MIISKIIALCCNCFSQIKRKNIEDIFNFNLIKGVKLIFNSCDNCFNKSKEKFENFGLAISCLFVSFKDLQEHSFKEQKEKYEKMKKRNKNKMNYNNINGNLKFISSYIIFRLYKLQTLESNFSSASMRKLPAIEFTTLWRNKKMTFFFFALR